MSAPQLAFSSLSTPVSVTPRFLVGPDADELEQAVTNKIRERARLLFEQSGGAPGNDEANWLQAESEVLHGCMEVRESGTWFSLRASIPETNGQGMQIVVRPLRVVLHAPRNEDSSNRDSDAIFLAATLPKEVDPPSAAASFRDHHLH